MIFYSYFYILFRFPLYYFKQTTKMYLPCFLYDVQFFLTFFEKVLPGRWPPTPAGCAPYHSLLPSP